MSAIAPSKTPVHYPESDGLPMADNTVQFRWIVTIQGGLDAIFADDPNVFVAGNLLWYPVEGDNTIRAAPDVLVAFGRPKGDRGSYLQWLEGNIAPQVVFEIISPGNRSVTLVARFKFFDRYGVEEYYLYDPDDGVLSGWIRVAGELTEIPEMHNWISPRLNVQFQLSAGELVLLGPDGRKFATYVELAAQREAAVKEKEKAERQREKAKKDKEKAEKDKLEAEQRAERLAAQLRASGIEPEA